MSCGERNQGGHRCNHGLARADVALNQPQHRGWLTQVLVDFLNHPLLGLG